MNFLNPGMFALLLPVLGLPLAIHLFNRKFPKTIKFPDLERIKKSLAERSKLMRWRHLLMTLLRTLVVLLALLAFLKPVMSRFGSGDRQGKEAGRLVVIVLDRSLSLSHQDGAKTSAVRNAEVEIGKILATLGGGDHSNAVLAASRPQAVLPEFTSQHDQLRAALTGLPDPYERADVGRAIDMAASLLEGRGGGVEVYFVSDFQRSNWADANFELLPEGARLFFVDAANGEERHNTALLSAELSSHRVAAGEILRVEIELANWAAEPAVIPVEAIVDGQFSVSGETRVEAWATARMSLEFSAPASDGYHTVDVFSPGDALPADNHRYLRFEVRQREEVLVLSDQEAEQSGALFITTALDPFEDRQGSFAPRPLPLSALGAGQLAAASKVVLTGAGQLGHEQVTRLLAFVENGGGLVYFLNGTHDSENLERFDEVAAQTVVPFHVAGRLTTENFGGRPQKFAKGEFRSPYLRLFRGESRQALARLEFYEIYRAFPTTEGQIILSYSDGTPAMGVADIGLGAAVFCNFAPAELASNLARERSFPAWLQEIVKTLTPEAMPESGQEVGSALVAKLWRRDLDNHKISDPEGDPVSFSSAPDGERVQVSFSAPLPGIYHLGRKQKPVWAEAVNVNTIESDLRAIDSSELTDRADTAPAGGGHFVTGADDFEELTTGKPIAHWFLIALAILLLVEMLLHRPFNRPVG